MTALQTRWVASETIGPRGLPSRPRASAVVMAERDRVLVVEHQRVVAVDIAQAFEAAGARVVGVASSVDTALALIADAGSLDGAVLDLDLRGETAFSVADELARRGVPFLFLASDDAGALPERFTHVTRCEKPFDVNRVVSLLLVQRVQQGWPWATRRHALEAENG